MRIARFDLAAFGHFTNTTLTFPTGAPDIHVVHGPNEAGKSTLRAALLDWFYGIHGRTPYGFKHGYPAMMLAARIEDPTLGGLEFRRYKKTQEPAGGRRRQSARRDAEPRPLAAAAPTASRTSGCSPSTTSNCSRAKAPSPTPVTTSAASCSERPPGLGI